MIVEGIAAVIVMVAGICLVLAAIILPFALAEVFSISKRMEDINRNLERVIKEGAIKITDRR